jgi:hypothetical protein
MVPAVAQDAAKQTVEKWRPKDGLYGLDSGKTSTPCENLPLHYIELGKRLIAANEMYECKIAKITDAAPGLLRLDTICDAANKKSRGVMTLRRIGEKSLVMRWHGPPDWRFVYCHEDDERGDSN